MDVRKHLRGLGWGGDGHSLGKNATGIKKPLLISHKRGLHGLGAKSQKESQADQWWLNAFDNALKDIGTGKESALSKVKDAGGKGSLYGFFVRGQPMEGTIGLEEDGSEGTATPNEGATTITISVSEFKAAEGVAKEEKRLRKEERRARKEHKRKREEDPVDGHQDEPDSKRSKESAAAVSEVDDSVKVKKNKKRRSKAPAPESEVEDIPNEVVVVEPMQEIESQPASLDTDKAARKQARAEKRARKEERRKARETTSDENGEVKRKEKKSKKQASDEA